LVTDRRSRRIRAVADRPFLWLWLPVVLHVALIFGLSSLSTVPEPGLPYSDKHAHFFMFGGLCALLVRAMAAGRWAGVTRATALSAFALTTIYGMSDEIHQRFVPGRTSSVDDLVADACGAAVAAGLLFAWAIIRRRRQSA
jgi:VanZ family protein